MYRIDTDSLPKRWIFTHGFRIRILTDTDLAALLQVNERTIRRWKQSDSAPRYALDHVAALLLGHIVPESWQARGLHFDRAGRMEFEKTGESFALNCLENCDYMARLTATPEPATCRNRRSRNHCGDNAAPVQGSLFAPCDLPTS